MHKKNLVIVTFGLIITLCFYFYQNKKQITVNLKNDFKNNYYKINSIEPSYTNYNDLKIIGKEIGESKIVMLGEQDHGDAITFKAKIRLIKYLHEQKKFNIIAIESDFYALSKICDKTNSENFDINLIKNNIYPVWSHSVECKELFNYIEYCNNKTNRLIITGFDSRHRMPYTEKYFIDEFKNTILLYFPEMHRNNLENILSLIHRVIVKERKASLTKNEKETVINFINKIISNKNKIQNIFWRQEVTNLKTYLLNALYLKKNRDIQMGKNLIFISDKFKNEKIIVWAANSHILKNWDMLPSNCYQRKYDSINMGSYFYNNYKNDIYILTFTSYSGKAGRFNFPTFKIKKPKSYYFENLIHEINNDKYAFINFKNIRNNSTSVAEKFYMKTLSHKIAINAPWLCLSDGIFYIKNMKPSTKY